MHQNLSCAGGEWGKLEVANLPLASTGHPRDWTEVPVSSTSWGTVEEGKEELLRPEYKS